MKKQLAYPRGFVHLNKSGGWSLAWRLHPDTGNHWDDPMAAPHFAADQLPRACDVARNHVDHMWMLLGRGDS
ncbi:hypothetical protein [Arthrobacter sp. HY1533]|uniref:hypothetical protein n=1 Tax=Arthrobacter sp. HY1533 TaxID=2970919 RepID=UPI0022B9E808|nr:hypothetical protein [Arthrobacter sp. HY1533]